MADSGGVQLGFEKLSGRENFNDWKFGMKMALIHENLFRTIEGYPDNDKTEQAQKDRLDQKALAKICLMVKPSAYAHVRSAKTAKEAWNNLQKAYEDKGLSRRLSLMRGLLRIRLENFATMEEYVNEAVSLSQKLTDMEQPIDDEFLGVIMLSGLTPEYDPMVMAIESSGVQVTSDFIKVKLLQDDKYGRNKGRHHTQETALFSNKSQGKKSVKCFKCGQPGHYKNQCTKGSGSGGKNKYSKAEKAFSAVPNIDTIGENKWLIDSGATTHMCYKVECLKDFHNSEETQILVANNQKVSSSGVGNASVQTQKGVKTISDVVYVPDLRVNLLSVSKIVEKGHAVVFSASGCSIYDADHFQINGEVVATASNVNGLYQLDTAKSSEQVVYITKSYTSQELWHRRLGHLNRISMDLLKKGMATGVDYGLEKGEACEVCLLGKQSRKPFKKTGGKRAAEVLGLVHTDLCGPMPSESWNGARYVFTLIDDYSRKIFAYFIKSKSEVLEVFKEYQTLVEKQTGKLIKKIRSDNGTEYVNTAFEEYLKSKGIEHQLTVRYTPEQNGVAERTNRTIVEMARCLIHEAKADERMWAEAVNTAVYLKNRSPHKAVMNSTPEEKWSGEKPNLKYLRVWGCIVQAHIPNALRKKFDRKSKQYIFVGYSERTKGYRLFDINKPGHIIISRDVVFFENRFLHENDIQTPVIPPSILTSEESPEDQITEDENDDESELEININANATQRRSERRRKAKEFPDHILYHVAEITSDPITVKEAMESPDHDRWKQAMDEEYTSLAENNVWTLVDRPTDRKVVQCKWVFHVKNSANGEVRYKARLVARGFTQTYGEDFTETFAPVVRNSTLRLLFALSVNLNLSIDHVDVTTAFLNSDLNEQIFMTQPEGYITDENKNKVCLLNKAIYGLKQSSRMWNKTAEDTLISLGYVKSKYESCVYIRKMHETIIIIALYVDDFLIFSNNDTEKRKLKKALAQNFKIKDLGQVKNCLGLNFEINESINELKINQKHYILKLLEKFGMLEAKVAITPIEANLKLEKGSNCDENIPFRCLIGSLMFLAVNTRPDIAFAVSFFSQYNNCYTNVHFKHAKRILRYLKGTIDKNLTFTKEIIDIHGYVDADWANDANDAKSYTGYVFKYAGGAVSWESKKQSTVSLSSTEAEYVAISQAAKEAIFIRGLLGELISCEKQEPTVIYNDSQSAQKLVSNPVFHNRTKHINVKHHFIREAVDRNDIKLNYLQSNEMVADVLTKGLHGPKHNCFRDKLGLI